LDNRGKANLPDTRKDSGGPAASLPAAWGGKILARATPCLEPSSCTPRSST
jgi:hypothetical protein